MNIRAIIAILLALGISVGILWAVDTYLFKTPSDIVQNLIKVNNKLTVEAFSTKINNVPTLQDALNQTDKPLSITTSTQGLIGFPDINRDDIVNSIYTKNLATEEAVRQRFLDILNQVQINT